MGSTDLEKEYREIELFLQQTQVKFTIRINSISFKVEIRICRCCILRIKYYSFRLNFDKVMCLSYGIMDINI